MRYVNVLAIDAVVGTLYVGSRHVVLYCRETFSIEEERIPPEVMFSRLHPTGRGARRGVQRGLGGEAAVAACRHE